MSPNPRQLKFVREYLKDGNATRAATAAGYSPKTAYVQGCNLLKNPKVAKALGKHLDKIEATADRITEETARLAFSNILDYVTINEDGQADVNLANLTREQAAAIEEITVDTTGGSGDGERRRVLRTRFKLARKKDSLELLAKIKKMLIDKVENTGPGGGPIQTSLTVSFVKPEAS